MADALAVNPSTRLYLAFGASLINHHPSPFVSHILDLLRNVSSSHSFSVLRHEVGRHHTVTAGRPHKGYWPGRSTRTSRRIDHLGSRTSKGLSQADSTFSHLIFFFPTHFTDLTPFARHTDNHPDTSPPAMFELLSKLHPTLSKYFSSAPLNNPSSTRFNRMCSPNAISRTASGLKHRMIDLMSCGFGRSRDPTGPRSSSDSCAHGDQASKSTVNTPSHPLEPKTFYESWLVCRGSEGSYLHPSVHCITPSDASAEERSAIIQMTKRLLSSMETSAHSSAVQTVLTEIDRLHPGQSKAQISLSLRDDHLNRRATVAQASVTSALAGWKLAERIGILTRDEADLLSRARDVFGARRTKPGEERGGSRGGESVQ